MNRSRRRLAGQLTRTGLRQLLFFFCVGIPLFSTILWTSSSHAQISLDQNDVHTVTFSDGRQMRGALGWVREMGAQLTDLSVDAGSHSIILIDDGLRYVFVPTGHIARTIEVDNDDIVFEIWQHVNDSTMAHMPIGSILNTTPFDEYGRRTITVSLPGKGNKTMIQGITKITPNYVQVEGLVDKEAGGIAWDMRLALSSIPNDVLQNLLRRQVNDPENFRQRSLVFEFLVQAQKYREAKQVLGEMQADFPGLKMEIDRKATIIQQQIFSQGIEEAKRRQEAGQPQLAIDIAQALIQRALGADTETMVQISELQKELEAKEKAVANALALVKPLVDQVLENPELPEASRNAITQFHEELQRDLRPSNLKRLDTFVRLADDQTQTVEKRLSLAISGWYIGPGETLNSLGEAESLVTVSQLVLEYLRTDVLRRRLEILQQLSIMEVGDPRRIAQIIAHMLPPLAPDQDSFPEDGRFEFEVKIETLRDGTPRMARYVLQLPPEYDPYRRYPCILTLGETSNTSPEAQIRWWQKQAERNGYIVIAPDWMAPNQREYLFSAKEHAIVLKSLRHALRRFSIDTDRVFLSGHFAGGDAAWDIGQAHPEHWAGVIPISAIASRYMNHYENNVRFHVPFYFINGGRDYSTRDANATVWNRQFSGQKKYDTTVVHYIGRGGEKFSDDIHNIFEWMMNKTRRFDVLEFSCSTLRPWDNYFWWLETELSRNSRMIHNEVNWADANPSAWTIEGKIKKQNTFHIKGAEDDASLWLLPDLVDFSQPIVVRGASGKFSDSVRPSRKNDSRRHASSGRSTTSLLGSARTSRRYLATRRPRHDPRK